MIIGQAHFYISCFQHHQPVTAVKHLETFSPPRHQEELHLQE